MIYCANNNTLYMQAKDACDDLGISESYMSKHLSGQRKTARSYVLTEVSDTSSEAIQSVRAWLLYSVYKIVLNVSDVPVLYMRGEKNENQKISSDMGSRSDDKGAPGVLR